MYVHKEKIITVQVSMIRVGLILLVHTTIGINGDFDLTLLHTNDVHAHVEEFSEHIGTCTANKKGVCFGGVARRYSAIEHIRQVEKNVLLLDAGDQYTGTLWCDHYKGEAASTL